MKSKGIRDVTPGYATWRWLSSIAAKQGQWLLGSLAGRGGYEAWVAHLIQGLQEPRFLATFETTTDPWTRSRMVGQKISELARAYARLTPEEKAELAKQAEVELKAGMEMLKGEKKRVLGLLREVTATIDR